MVRYKWYIVPAEPCSGQSGHAPSGRADRILYLWEDIAMTITKNEAGGALRIALTGRLDTNTAPQLETELKASLRRHGTGPGFFRPGVHLLRRAAGTAGGPEGYEQAGKNDPSERQRIHHGGL